jgi:hypothetical protein
MKGRKRKKNRRRGKELKMKERTGKRKGCSGMKKRKGKRNGRTGKWKGWTGRKDKSRVGNLSPAMGGGIDSRNGV